MEAQQRYALIDQLTRELESAEQSVRAIEAAAEVDRHTEIHLNSKWAFYAWFS